MDLRAESKLTVSETICWRSGGVREERQIWKLSDRENTEKLRAVPKA